ncbi:MAG: MarR family transcriptional regulator [Pseudomonadota bacterium]
MQVTAARLHDQLCFALYSASSHLTAIYRTILEPMGLTYPQFVVMMALWNGDGVSITEVANQTGLSKATLTPLLKKLEEKGLVSLERVPTNERQKKVSITKEGWTLASQSITAADAAFHASGLTPKQADTIITLCNKIRHN